MGTDATYPGTRLPDCDLCETQGVKRMALYDAKTKGGPWAYLCQDHFDRIGPGRLGTGFGQRLHLKQEPHDYEPGTERHPMHTDPLCRICGEPKKAHT